MLPHKIICISFLLLQCLPSKYIEQLKLLGKFKMTVCIYFTRICIANYKLRHKFTRLS